MAKTSLGLQSQTLNVIWLVFCDNDLAALPGNFLALRVRKILPSYRFFANSMTNLRFICSLESIRVPGPDTFRSRLENRVAAQPFEPLQLLALAGLAFAGFRKSHWARSTRQPLSVRQLLQTVRWFPYLICIVLTVTLCRYPTTLAACGELYAPGGKGQSAALVLKQPVASASYSYGLPQQQRTAIEDFRTGEDFNRKLSDIQSVNWEGIPLKKVLADAETTHRIKIWIDRRVDISQPITLNLSGVSVGQSLAQLAQRCQCEVAFMNPLVAFVPQDQSASLLALRADLRRQVSELPASLRRDFLDSAPVSWERLSQPNNLLRQWLQPVSENLAGLDSLPHDVWDAGQLPDLPLVDRLLLLAFGFQQHLQIVADDGSVTLSLVEAQGELPLECLIDSDDWQTKLQQREADWQASWPNVAMKNQRRQWILTGPLKDVRGVLQVALQDAPAPAAAVDLSRQRFELNVENQMAGSILKTIAVQTKLELTMDPTTLPALQKRIDLRVKDLPLDDLLKEVASRVNVRVVREENAIRVFPAE